MENLDVDTRLERQLAVALKSEPEVWTADCLEPDRIIALVERSVPEAEAAPLMEHITLCARCRREYAETVELMQLAEEVRALEAQVAASPVVETPPVHTPQLVAHTTQTENLLPIAARISPLRAAWQKWCAQRWFSPGVGFALGAAAAGVALFLVLTPAKRVEHDRLSEALKGREAQLARLEQEKQALGQELDSVKRQSQGDAAHLAQDVERLNARVKQQGIQVARLEQAETTLQQMPLPSADWLQAHGGGLVRGVNGTDDHQPEIVPIRPVNIALLDARPILECRPVSGATGYQISLEIENSNEAVPAPKQLSATRWQVTTPLQPGRVYRWAVTAQHGSELIHSPFVKFTILNAAQKHEIETARQKYADSPLTLGAVYARLGLSAEAEQQFRAALKSDATRPIASRWLKEIETQNAQP